VPTFTDAELGTIIIRHSVKARSIRMRVAPNGSIRISAPLYTPTLYIKRLVKNSRDQLSNLLAQHDASGIDFQDGMQIGKSHHLTIRQGSSLTAKRHAQQIIVTLPSGKEISDPDVVTVTREAVIGALRIEAKSYLPKRLSYLAQQHGYTYSKLRFSHASGRWGSCSSNFTISLNIALMKLPFEIIDYVLIHELAHTKEMNHSQSFWAHVAEGDPQFKFHRNVLKTHTPSI
jgi:predicted metal-dependent hydrolase